MCEKMDKKKILIVDDEADILKLTSIRLRKLGYDVLTAVNGQEGLDSIRENKPDLVLLDMVLPIMNGEEICYKIKNDEQLKHIPIILFTASSNFMTAEKTKMIGAEDCVIKPFDPTVLREKVEKILAQGVI